MDQSQTDQSTNDSTTVSELEEYTNQLLMLGLILGILYKPITAGFSNIRGETHPPTPLSLYRLPPYFLFQRT